MPDARSVTTVKGLLSLFANSEQIAAPLGVPYGEVKDWLRLGRVPQSYWPALIAAARRAGIAGVSHALLARLPTANGAQNVADLLDLWPSITALAGDLGLAHSTVRSWAGERNSIPLKYWDGVVKSAKSYGIRHLTDKRLRAICTERASGKSTGAFPRTDCHITTQPLAMQHQSRDVRDQTPCLTNSS